MLKTKKVHLPIYDEKVTFIAYDDPDELQAWVKKQCGTELDADLKNYDGGFFSWKGYQYITFDISAKKVRPGVIAHECKHAVNNMYILISAELDRYNDEPECYLLGWYVDEAHKFLDDLLIK